MKLSALYKFVIEKGIDKDPRGRKAVEGLLKQEKSKFEKLTGKEKEEFDTARLTNPYADSRILFGAGDEEIASAIVGIDMETPELLLADRLKEKGSRIDLAITHHPEGRAYATFYEVMSMQCDILNRWGVPINIAESITEPRMDEVGRRVSPQNHARPVDAARLLNMPFMSIHTIADNHVNEYLQKYLDGEKPQKLEDTVELLKKIPEYIHASKVARGPYILLGSGEKRTGKIFVDMTGGTEGSVEAIDRLAQSGVGTIIGMHMSEDHYKNAKKCHVNVIIAGHISSDNLGLNLLFDSVEKEFGKLEIIECSGFKRVKRK